MRRSFTGFAGKPPSSWKLELQGTYRTAKKKKRKKTTTECMLNWQGVKRGLIRVANRPGMPGTVAELTSGIPCPGPGHVCPGIY